MTPTRARKRIRDLARAGAWRVTEHGAERMAEREVDDADVYRVLTSAMTCRATPRGRWRLDGTDSYGDPLAAVVEIRGLVLVVTVFRGDE